MTREEWRFRKLEQLRQLELASLAEASTLAMLVLGAVPLKHLGGWDLGVQILGPIHGLAFVAYLWNVWQIGACGCWRRAEIARLVVCAFVPFGGFLNWPWLVRRTRLRVKALAAEIAAD